MTLTRSRSPEKARGLVEQLWAKELELSDEHRGLSEAMGDVVSSAGAALLDAKLEGEGPADSGGITSARAELEQIEAAITEARHRRRQTILAVFKAEAEPIRKEAAKLTKEAAARQRKTDELLAELEDFEDVRYVPDPGEKEPTMRLPNGVEWAAYGNVSGSPKTELLANRARELEAQAAQLEARNVEDSWMIEADSAAELVEAIRTWDAMKIAAPLPDVLAWVRRVEGPALDRMARNVSEPSRQSIRFHLTWQGGRIIEERSKVLVPALDY